MKYKPGVVSCCFPIAVSVWVGALFACGHAAADTFMFNATWGFDTPGTRSARANALDLEERKRGGFYESFQTTITYDDNVFITYDCTGARASAVGNNSVTSSEARTSSPSTGSEIVLDAVARGNQSDVHGVHDGSVANEQTSTGDVRSDVVSTVSTTTHPLNASGGVSTQTNTTDQSLSGVVTASAEGGVGCNFFDRADHATMGHLQ